MVGAGVAGARRRSFAAASAEPLRVKRKIAPNE